MPDPEPNKKLADLDSSIEIKEAEAEERMPPSVFVNSNKSVLENSKAKKSNRPKKPKRAKWSALWLLLAFSAIAIFAAGYINLIHVGVLERCSRFSGDQIYKIYMCSDLINAYQALNMRGSAVAEAEDLLARTAGHSSEFRPMHATYAKLLLARTLIADEKQPRARKLVSEAISELSAFTQNGVPKNFFPDEIGDLLCDLANDYVSIGDRKFASQLFQKSADYWNRVCPEAASYEQGAPSIGHKAYMLLDAASNAEEMGDIKGAAEFTKLAVESAERDNNWGATTGQITRLVQLARLYNRLNMYEEAQAAANKAIAIPGDESEYFKSDAREELKTATEALGNLPQPKTTPETNKGEQN